MLTHTYADAAGRLFYVMVSGAEEQQDAAAAAMGWALVDDQPSALGATGQLGATFWYDGTAIVPRPLPPAPPTMTAGVTVTWAGLPPGAVVTVDPLNGAAPATDVVEPDGTVEIGLPMGAWRVSVAEAFPTLAASWLIEVLP